MSYNNFKTKTDKDGIVTLTIDVPNQTMNVWTPDFIEEFDNFITDFNTNDAMKGLVITSGKKNAFMAGADLEMMSANNTAGSEFTKADFEKGMTLTKALRKIENGGWTTRQMQREGKKAKPAAAAIMRLMGIQAAAEMCTQGKNLNPKKALAQGLVHEVVEAGSTEKAAKAWVKANIEKGVLAPQSTRRFALRANIS